MDSVSVTLSGDNKVRRGSEKPIRNEARENVVGVTLVLLMFLLAVPAASAESANIEIDGSFNDWTGIAPVHDADTDDHHIGREFLFPDYPALGEVLGAGTNVAGSGRDCLVLLALTVVI